MRFIFINHEIHKSHEIEKSPPKIFAWLCISWVNYFPEMAGSIGILTAAKSGRCRLTAGFPGALALGRALNYHRQNLYETDQ
jgi:hypothetical protein